MVRSDSSQQNKKRGRNDSNRVKEVQESDSTELQDECVGIFVAAQMLEHAGDMENALEHYEYIISATESLTTIEPFVFDPSDIPAKPPLSIIASVAHTNVAHTKLDAALEEAAQMTMQTGSRNLVHKHLTTAVQLWPENAVAAVSLANLERENGAVHAALELYGRVASLDDEDEDDGLGDEEERGWSDEFILAPRAQCMAVATYMQALLLEQTGQHEAALPPLQKFGFRYRISPGVWAAAHAAAPANPRPALTPAEKASPVRMFDSAVPPPLLGLLRGALAPGASFWRETEYENRGYYSFWYDPSMEPRTAIELLIRDHLLPLTGRDDIVGCEWWAHTRLVGRNLGHQLHFDTEENTLEAKGEVVHPVLSSVVYLSGGATGGGPTLIFDQTSDPSGREGGGGGKEGGGGGEEEEEEGGEEVLATKGWLAYPRDGALMLFPGNRLHGVLPGKPPARGSASSSSASSSSSSSSASPSETRITLMVGFWNRPVVNEGVRQAIGPCAPLPPVTPTCTWPDSFAIPEEEKTSSSSSGSSSSSTKKVAGDAPRQLVVEEIAPVWSPIDELPPPPPSPSTAAAATTTGDNSSSSSSKQAPLKRRKKEEKVEEEEEEAGGAGRREEGEGGEEEEEEEEGEGGYDEDDEDDDGFLPIPPDLDQRFFVRSPALFRRTLFESKQ